MQEVDPVDEEVRLEFELAGADLERLVVVGSDLEYLQDLPTHRLLTHTEVRLAASVLRRLLMDGQLKQVWRSIGASGHAQPMVLAVDIDTPLNNWPAPWVRYAWAGGASPAAAHHTGLILALAPKEEHERYGSVEAFLEVNHLPMSGDLRRLDVQVWLDSTSAAIQANELGLVRVARKSVLRYVANRKGGVHFDPERRLDLASGLSLIWFAGW